MLEGDHLREILDFVRAKYGAVAQSMLSSNDVGVKAVAEAPSAKPQKS